jgi:hypothetical protein
VGATNSRFSEFVLDDSAFADASWIGVGVENPRAFKEVARVGKSSGSVIAIDVVVLVSSSWSTAVITAVVADIVLL